MLTPLQLNSPVSGRTLRPDGRNILSAGSDERWPVIDGIPYLRVGRDALVASALQALDAGEVPAATAILLRDRDDWAPGQPASDDDCMAVVRERDTLTFRAAMQRLRFGPVADYLAHRWSDPTFLSGLALAEAYWQPRATVLEIACGTGHFLRAFAPHAEAVIGSDVVFSKLWLARHFVAPSAALVCFDAAAPWPIPPESADILFCHDALYFLPDQPAICARMRQTVRQGGAVLVGHVHNAAAANHSAGEPVEVAALAAWLSPAALFDDRELTEALLDRRTPCIAETDHLSKAPAVSVASCARGPVVSRGLLDLPPRGAALRRNPLYVGGSRAERRFPSPRYESEYGELVTYPPITDAPLGATATGEDDPAVRRRELVDLPARW